MDEQFCVTLVLVSNKLILLMLGWVKVKRWILILSHSHKWSLVTVCFQPVADILFKRGVYGISSSVQTYKQVGTNISSEKETVGKL